MAPNKLGRVVAKGLHIDLDYRQRHEPKDALRSAADSFQSIELYEEREPTVKEFLLYHRPTLRGTQEYARSLFPFLSWIFHYNWQWLLGDVIAGVTVGFVVIPQGMAYALLAQLSPEYGLYTSFVGFLLYWAFATSKDITIGTVAVMSQLVGNVVLRVRDNHPEFAPEDIARALALIAGAVLLFIGLVRLGWVVEFIPLVAITSFMTGAAFSIACGQVPALLGIEGVNTRQATYKVIIDTLKALPTANLNAAMGMSALFLLYLLRWFCNFMSRRQPKWKKFWFFMSTLRMAFVILLYVLISYLANRHISDPDLARFRILGDVPSGFRHAGVPIINPTLLGALAPDLPATIIVLIIEHIAISKSFGRINNYVIDPSQELVAVGFTNVFGPFLGGYPATGSFSRTAIKSKAGVRTPLAGIFTAVIVLLAIYVLTVVFFYIPMASLAGLIIHAVGDLITPPNVVYQFWEVSPLEVFIFFGGVLLTVFTNIENGIYLTIIASFALLLIRLAKAKGHFMGRVRIYRVTRETAGKGVPFDEKGEPVQVETREAFIPVDKDDGSNPHIDIQSPHPGVFIFRFGEGFNYTNQAHYMDALVAHVFKHTRRTVLDRFDKIGDRPWNDPGPRRGQKVDMNDTRPILRAVVLDCASVNNVDVTSIQGLIDVRNQLDRYADPEIVEWHFANVNNRWTRRALAAAGFGYPSIKDADNLGRWRPIFSVAAVDHSSEVDNRPDVVASQKVLGKDEEDGIAAAPPPPPPASDGVAQVAGHADGKLAAVQGTNRPFFHIDVAAAVESAVLNAQSKEAVSSRSSSE
ncbi:sulfate permease [Sodiomyces alkalinus F11]|uniref:Sulfate permease n=1 Tax=Sodiomyces alkalinus (strain CBS 110278 / VKM F-3762 / F11) TaxID=1314773 RepID=A0A3N2PKS8_SODAK|nr:sulfate permease [Sodiomyces alkalinus F11]ROT35127.1 sulfate permease [Sodiomyces alkalinus F11]